MINLLDSKIYNKIAAGEVVERPASVVKELVENSIDAGAKHIFIEITGGGIDKIRVIDDGKGIEREDLKKAFLPHATSKISSAEDLENITTLGFRGEALASIASVAKVTVMTKTADENEGSKLHIEGGEFGEAGYSPCINGTEIIVENLFFNTPARAKFLKKPKSEENEITDMISRLMLANPNIAFTYNANDKKQLVDFGLGLDDAIIGVYGKDFIQKTVYISAEKYGIKVYGYVSNPDFTKNNRTYQTFIVNGRYVSNQIVSMALGNAFEHFTVKRSFPAGVIFIDIPNDEIDVNVHPAKTEIRFLNNKNIYDILYHAVADNLNEFIERKTEEMQDELERKYEQMILESRHISSTAAVEQTLPEEVQREITEYRAMSGSKEDKEKLNSLNEANQPNTKLNPFEDDPYVGEIYKGDCKTADGGYIGGYLDKKVYGTDDCVEFYNSCLQEAAEEKKVTERIKEEAEKYVVTEQIKLVENEDGYNVLGQVFQTYLILEFSDFLLLIDQHAAHERLLFNDFMEKFKNKRLASQPLLFPEIINANPKESEFLNEKLPYLRDLGIDIEEFGNNSFKINALPMELATLNINEFFKDLFADMNIFKRDEVPEILRTEIAKKACKSAIKAGDFLSTDEIKNLVKLLNGNFNLRCPHGRPITVKIEKYELEKWFKRVV